MATILEVIFLDYKSECKGLHMYSLFYQAGSMDLQSSRIGPCHRDELGSDKFQMTTLCSQLLSTKLKSNNNDEGPDTDPCLSAKAHFRAT